MVPIIQEEHTEVLIVVGRSRAVDDNASKDTLPRLESKVGMIPSRAVLQSSPSVRHSVFGGSGTLCNGHNTILVVGVVLANAMPMNAGSIIGVDQVVRHMYRDCIAPVCKQSRSGDGTKDRQLIQTQRCVPTHPFTAIAERETPSGAIVTSSRVSQYSLVTPVSGASVVSRQPSEPSVWAGCLPVA